MADSLRLQISEVCSLLDVDGIRGDMTVNKAAAALAALEERDEVTPADVQRVIALCLNHRCARACCHRNPGCVRAAPEVHGGVTPADVQRVVALCLGDGRVSVCSVDQGQ